MTHGKTGEEKMNLRSCLLATVLVITGVVESVTEGKVVLKDRYGFYTLINTAEVFPFPEQSCVRVLYVSDGRIRTLINAKIAHDCPRP